MPNPSSRFAMSVFTLATVGLLSLLASGCGGTQAAPTPPPPPAVTVAPVTQKEIVEWQDFTGHTEPVESVEVRPRVSGYIQAVRFQSGQLVKKGDVLFEIDPRWNQAVFDQRQAEFDQARRENDRTKQLLASKAISTEEADGRKATFEEAKAMLDSARLDLEYCLVRAPIDGRVSRALMTEGNYVSGVAGGASMLTTLVSVNPVYVYADVDEASLLKFNELVAAGKLGADGKIPVELQLGDESDFPHKGTIESFDNQVNSDTGSILLRAVFQNDDGRILPGLFAHIRLPLSERHPALLVNESSIGTDQANKFVMTISTNDTVEYRPIKLGPLIAGQRVVTTGLTSGDRIVVSPVMARVHPGMTVNPVVETAALTTAMASAKR